MFEDLIKPTVKVWGQKSISKDSLIKAMKENILHKEVHIQDLLDELFKRNVTINDLEKELDYLKQL